MPTNNNTVPPCDFFPLIQTCMNPALFQGGDHPNWSSWKSAKEMLMNTRFHTTVMWVLVVGCWCSFSSRVPVQTGEEQSTMRRGDLNSSRQKSYQIKEKDVENMIEMLPQECICNTYINIYITLYFHCSLLHCLLEIPKLFTSAKKKKKIIITCILVVCWLSLLK